MNFIKLFWIMANCTQIWIKSSKWRIDSYLSYYLFSNYINYIDEGIWSIEIKSIFFVILACFKFTSSQFGHSFINHWFIFGIFHHKWKQIFLRLRYRYNIAWWITCSSWRLRLMVACGSTGPSCGINGTSGIINWCTSLKWIIWNIIWITRLILRSSRAQYSSTKITNHLSIWCPHLNFSILKSKNLFLVI